MHIHTDLEKVSWLPQGSGEFVVAFAAHKLFSPVRVMLSLATIPYVARVAERLVCICMCICIYIYICICICTCICMCV